MYENVRKVLNEMGQDFAEEIRTRLKDEDAVATGELLDSIGFELEEDEEGLFTLYLTHADYFHYVNENTKPHWPPKYDKGGKLLLADWITARGLETAESTGNKSLPTVEQLNFLIRRKISEDGTQGHYFFEATLNGLLERYYPLIVQAIYDDIENDMLQGLI